MDEETDRIRQHIDSERQQLGRDLDEIEDRVKSATDLRAHFNKNTGLILGAAVAGGFLLSVAFHKSPSAPGGMSTWESDSRERGIMGTAAAAQLKASVPKHLHRVTETLDNIFEGLVAVASDRLCSFVADAVPGFRTHYDALERQRGRSSVHQMTESR